jgi:hypothetical protein
VKPLSLPYKHLPNSSDGYATTAMLNVQVARPEPRSPRTKRFEAIIDSGASRCLFHSDFAVVLGIDLTKCTREVTQGIGGNEDVYLHEITLFIPGGPVSITAGFKHNFPIAGLLGMAGFFDHFKVTFDPTSDCCILERLYKA